MKEKLLHFIWKLRLFPCKKLMTTDGKGLDIISTGIENRNSGPDFSNARIEIGGQLWAGNVEIHLNSSEWYAHHHEKDSRYDSVILHVVWEHDVDIFRSTNEAISTLELKHFISKKVFANYKHLFDKKKDWINCENEIHKVNLFAINHWFERLYFERLEQKAERIQDLLKQSNNNWEYALFQLLARNFGLKVNGDAFANTVSSIDMSIVRKVSDDQFRMKKLLT